MQLRKLWLSLLALGLAFGCETSVARAGKDVDPSGTWKWERTREDRCAIQRQAQGKHSLANTGPIRWNRC